jgi:hypothetical protein
MSNLSREFTLGRNYTLRSVMGHTIVFKKDEPTWVPREIEAEAMAIGAVPVDGEVHVTEVDENPAKNAGPDDVIERKEKIKTAIKQIVSANQRNDFSASGSPKVPALNRVLGFEVDAHERDVIWTEFKAELSGDDA